MDRPPAADRRDDRRRGGNGGRYEVTDDLRETGLIEKLCDAYGFIDCIDRRQKLFFHYSNVRGDVSQLRLGDGLEFRVATDRRTGKLVACDVVPLPPGAVCVETVSIDRIMGSVEREPGRREGDVGRITYTGPDGGLNKVSFSPRDVDTDAALAAGDKVEFSVATDKRDGRVRAVRVALVERAPQDLGFGVVTALKEAFGFLERDSRFGEGEIFFHYSEYDGDVEALRVGTDVQYAEAKQGAKLRAINVKALPPGYFDVIDPTPVNGVVLHAIAPQRSQQGRRQDSGPGKIEYVSGDNNKAKVSFTRADVVEGDGTPLRKGDKVAFNICADRRYPNRRRAVNIVRTGGPDAGSRETGVVDVVKDDYGFIRCCERPARAFFHFAELMDPSVDIRVGDEVEFFVIADSDDKEWAIRINVLPQGSVSFDTVSDEVSTGYVVKAAHGQRRGELVLSTDAQPQPVVPDVDASEDTGRESDDSERPEVPRETPPGTPPPGRIQFSNSALADKQAKLRAGDRVTFRVATEKATGARRAVDIVLVERAPDKLDRGFLCALRGDFGFIETSSHQNCVFFHFNDLADTKPEELQLGMEVEYALGRAKGKTAAKNVRAVGEERQTREEVDEDVLIGVVQRAYTANATAEAGKYGGLIRYESDKCELLKYPYGVTALDNAAGEANHPRVGTTVSFRLVAAPAGTKKRRATLVRALYDSVDDNGPRVKGKITELVGGKGAITADDQKVYSFYTGEAQDTAAVSLGDDVDFVVARNRLTGADDACRVRRAYARKAKVIENSFGPIRQPRGPEGKGWAPRESLKAL